LRQLNDPAALASSTHKLKPEVQRGLASASNRYHFDVIHQDLRRLSIFFSRFFSISEPTKLNLY